MSALGYTHLLKSNVTNIQILAAATAIAPTSGGNAFKVATTTGINTTGSSLIIVAVSDNFAGATPTLTDSAGNTWTLVRTQTDTLKNRIKMYMCASPITSASHTVTYSTSTNSFPTVMVLALSGTKTSGVLDQQNSTGYPSSGTTSGTPGSITPTESNEIVITSISAGGSAPTPNAPTIGSGYTVTNSQNWVSNYKSAMAYIIQSSATATNPTWTFNGADSAAIMILSFKAA